MKWTLHFRDKATQEGLPYRTATYPQLHSSKMDSGSWFTRVQSGDRWQLDIESHRCHHWKVLRKKTTVKSWESKGTTQCQPPQEIRRIFSKLSCAPLGGRLFPHQRLHRILHWACHCLRTLRGMLAAHFWKIGGWIGTNNGCKRGKLLPTQHLKFEMFFWLRIAFGWRLVSQFWHRPPSLPRRLVGVLASASSYRHQSSVISPA